MLFMGRTLPEIPMARDTLIFLLQHLDIAINLKKSVLHPVTQTEFLSLVIDTSKMTLVLSEKKIKYVSQRRQVIFTQPNAFVLNLKINWPFVINRLIHFISKNPSFNIFNRSKY